MAKPVLYDPQFLSEAAAFDYVEGRLWPEGPICPHCGATADKIGRLEGVRSKPSKKNPEGVLQIGLRKCYACRGRPLRCAWARFSRIATCRLRLWLQAIHLFCASKKGISTRQLQRMLDCGMKTAWYLGHRIREMMDPRQRWPAGRRRQDGRGRRNRNGPVAQDAAPGRFPPQHSQRQGSQPR